MINLFIDTNVYLDFYHLSDDDIEELKKLLAAIQEGEIRLFITKQVKDEFHRNRETKIAASLKMLDGVKLGIVYPRIMQGYEEYNLMQTEVRNFSEHLSALRSKLDADIESKSLGPDTLVGQLFGAATLINEDEDVIVAAQRRSLLRRPPGKKDSIGDAINWEALIKHAPNEEEFFVVSIDGDFVTPLKKEDLNSYLVDEWETLKHSNIKLYKSLGLFFKDKFPNIKLAQDYKRVKAIQNLVSSGNFTSTHRYITKVKQLGELSDQEVRDIYDAALTNNQIYWLGQDSDVNAFIRDLMSTRSELLEEGELAKLEELYPVAEEEPNIDIDLEDLPF